MQGDRINIKRSDGRAHDLTAIAAHYNATKSTSTGPGMTSKKLDESFAPAIDETHDHDAPITIKRSDGLHHDLVNIFRMPGEMESAKATVDERPAIELASTASTTSYRIVHMSDTREFLGSAGKFVTKFLPDGDILIHSGNFTANGTDEEYENFNNWLGEVSSLYPFRVVVPGSRDVKRLGSRWTEIKRRLSNATHVLCHEEATILGMRIYGCPWFWGNKYNYSLRLGFNFGQDEGNRFNEIPDGIHILVSHGPAKGKLDAIYTVEGGKRTHMGSDELLNTINKTKPLAHLFGHCSDSRGYIPPLGRSPLFVNSTMCDKDCKVLFSTPHVIKATELFSAVGCGGASNAGSNRNSFTSPSLSASSAQALGLSSTKSTSSSSGVKCVAGYWSFEIGSYI